VAQSLPRGFILCCFPNNTDVADHTRNPVAAWELI